MAVVRFPTTPAGLVVRRRPGRPTKVHKAPVVREDDYNAAVNGARRQHVEGDGLVRLGADAGPLGVLEAIIVRVAEEVAGLGFEARRAEGEGRDASQTRSRRITGLLQLVGLVRDRELLQRVQGGLTEAAVAPLKRDFHEAVREVAEEVLPSEKLAVFLERVEARLG